VKEFAMIEAHPRQDGRNMTMVLNPIRKPAPRRAKPAAAPAAAAAAPAPTSEPAAAAAAPAPEAATG
jgi:translation initiation factor IF-3